MSGRLSWKALTAPPVAKHGAVKMQHPRAGKDGKVPMANGRRDSRRNVIQFHDVSKSYTTQRSIIHAIAPTSFHVEAGEFLSVVGPSGCGKSTLLKMVAGLVPVTAGHLEVEGQTVTGPVTDLGIVFQDDLLMEWRKTLDNVLVQGEFRGIPKKRLRDKALALLDMVGLTEFLDVYPHELSGGMRQRVSICRALVHEPQLLLMDEPFGSLDALTRDQMTLDLQRILRNTGSTVLFITHSIAEAIFLSDRVLVLGPAPGRIVEEVHVDLPRPRRMAARESAEFGEYVQRVRGRLSAMGVIRDDDLTQDDPI